MEAKQSNDNAGDENEQDGGWTKVSELTKRQKM